MYYCEIHNNVLREQECMYVDMAFKQGADRAGVGGELIHRRDTHDLRVPARLPVPALIGT